MKNLLMVLVVTLFIYNVNAQEKIYLLFEFMRVDNEQEVAYMETEGFWENIHPKVLLVCRCYSLLQGPAYFDGGSAGNGLPHYYRGRRAD